MSAAPVTSEMGGSPSIGELLLRHGYVSQEKLDWAEGVHRETGEPIGQILVEDGALSRLELASALAEQWSATSSWMPSATHVGVASEPARGGDSGHVALPDELLARVAAVEAAVKVRSTAATTEVEVVSLSHAVDELLGRIGGVESSLENAARRYEELVTAVDEAVCAHDARLDQLEARDSEPPARDEALAERVDELAGRALVEPFELDQLRIALVEQIDELAAATRLLPDAHNELRAELRAVAGRLEAGDVGALATLGDTVTRMDEEAALRAELVTGLGEQLASLVGRVDALVAALDHVPRADELAELAATVEELAARPAGDADIAERLDQVATTAGAGAAELVLLRDTVAALEERLERSAESAALAELRAMVEGFVSATDSDGGVASTELAARVAGLAERLDQLAQRVEEAAAPGDLQRVVDGLAARLDTIADGDDLSELRARLDEVSADAARQRESVDSLTAVVGELSVLPHVADDDLRALERAVRQVEERASAALLPDDLGGIAAQLDAQDVAQRELAATVDELRLLGERARDAEPDPVHAELRLGLDELSGRLDSHDAAAERLAGVERLLADAGSDEGIAPLVARLEALEAAASGDAVAVSLTALSERIATLESRSEAGTAGSDEGALAERLSVLEARSSQDQASRVLGELAVRLDHLERAVAATSSVVGEHAPEETRLAVFEARFAELEHAVASAAARPATGSDESVSERELDYLRVAVEGVGMRLAEQQRALAPLLRSPDIGARMDALAARVGDLLSAGLAAVVPANGEPGQIAVGGAELLALSSRLEGIESSVRSDREKLLVQIERLASSFDWRIRRIEDGTADDDEAEPEA